MELAGPSKVETHEHDLLPVVILTASQRRHNHQHHPTLTRPSAIGCAGAATGIGRGALPATGARRRSRRPHREDVLRLAHGFTPVARTDTITLQRQQDNDICEALEFRTVDLQCLSMLKNSGAHIIGYVVSESAVHLQPRHANGNATRHTDSRGAVIHCCHSIVSI